MPKKAWIWIIALVAIVIAGVWLSRRSPQGVEATSPLRIGAIDSLTGPFAAYGEPVRDGMLLAVEEINAKGGINGQKCELLLEDDGGDPKNAVNAFTKLATVEKVPVIVGPLSSGCSMATAPLADRNKVVQISTLAGTIDLSKAGDYVFRIYPSSEVGSRYVARIAVEKFKAKRAALFFANDAFGVTSRKFITEVLKHKSVEIVADETFNGGDRDFRTQLTKIIQVKPDVLMCSAYYEEGAQILVQAKQLGLNLPILGEDGWFGPIAAIAGDALKNLYFANIAIASEFGDNKPMQDFIAAFKKRYNKPPNSYSAAGYTGVFIAKHAVETGGYDGTKIKDSLYKTDVLTAFGRVKYNSDGDNVGAEYALFQLNEKNEPVLVK